MPIKLQQDFPATRILNEEDIFAIDNLRANKQDIRPLKILILNLMPNKIATEIQLLRLISQSPLQIDVDFLKMTSHQCKTTSIHHLNKFYLDFPQVETNNYDALIITGAPIETLPFEEVDYWEELKKIMEWSQSHTSSVLHICWGAQAGLYYHYGIEKVPYEQKLFGVFSQKVVTPHRLVRGFDDIFYTPQSRYTGINLEQVDPDKLTIIAKNNEIGPTILQSHDLKNVFLLGHFEYDSKTLHEEYLRDQKKGLPTPIPENYYRFDDPNCEIINHWRGHSFLLFHNWLNDVYQLTPYKMTEVGKILV